MKSAQLDQPSQYLDDISDLSCQCIYDDWRFRPPIAGRPGDMTYSYYNGGLMVVVHLELMRVDGEPRKFCAEFKSLSPIIHHGLPAAGRQIVEAKLPLAHLTCNHVEQSVLVKIIEITEQSQEGREGWVPSVVRLHSLNFCSHTETQFLDSPRLSGELCGGVRNWKLQRSVVGRGILPDSRIAAA